MQPVQEDVGPSDRNAEQGIAVPAAGLDHQHARIGVLGEPVGERAASRSGTDNDVAVRPVRHESCLPSCLEGAKKAAPASIDAPLFAGWITMHLPACNTHIFVDSRCGSRVYALLGKRFSIAVV